MSVDSVWEPILDIFSHHCTEPVFHSDCWGWKHTLSFSCDIFFPGDCYCLLISRWRCSLSAWPVFTACSHLKVTDSQLPKVIHHAAATARLKQQKECRRARIEGSFSSFFEQTGWEEQRERRPSFPHSLFLFTSSRIHSVCIASAHLWVVFGHCLLILLSPLSPNPLPH